MGIRITVEEDEKTYEFELPDWATGHRLMLLAGMTLVAVKYQDDDWYVKTVRCNHCGECCLEVGESYYVKADDEGKCLALRKEGDKWLCGAGTDRPFQCLEDPLVEGCNIKRKVVRPK